jgi:hypothetical protein
MLEMQEFCIHEEISQLHVFKYIYIYIFCHVATQI